MTPGPVPPRVRSWGTTLAAALLVVSGLIRVIAWDERDAGYSQPIALVVARDVGIALAVVLLVFFGAAVAQRAFVRKASAYAKAGAGEVLAVGPIDGDYVRSFRELGMLEASVSHSLVALIAMPDQLVVVGGYGDFEVIAAIPYGAIRDCEPAAVTGRYRYSRGLRLTVSAGDAECAVGIGALGAPPLGLRALPGRRLEELAVAVRARAFDGAAS